MNQKPSLRKHCLECGRPLDMAPEVYDPEGEASCCARPAEIRVNGLRPGEFRVRGWSRFWKRLEDGFDDAT